MSAMEITTEKESGYTSLENMTATELLRHINNEDKTVPLAVEKALPQIERLSLIVAERMREGGRLAHRGEIDAGRIGGRQQASRDRGEDHQGEQQQTGRERPVAQAARHRDRAGDRHAHPRDKPGSRACEPVRG